MADGVGRGWEGGGEGNCFSAGFATAATAATAGFGSGSGM